MQSPLKLILMIGVQCALFFLALVVFSRFNLVPSLTFGTFWALIAAAFMIIIKALTGELASGEVAFHKQGYDFAVATMATALSTLGLQLATSNDLFAGAPDNIIWQALAQLDVGDVAVQRRIFLTLVFLGTTLVVFLTARVSRSIRDGTTRYPDPLAAFNFLLGAATFAANLLIILSKKG